MWKIIKTETKILYRLRQFKCAFYIKLIYCHFCCMTIFYTLLCVNTLFWLLKRFCTLAGFILLNKISEFICLFNLTSRNSYWSIKYSCQLCGFVKQSKHNLTQRDSLWSASCFNVIVYYVLLFNKLSGFKFEKM